MRVEKSDFRKQVKQVVCNSINPTMGISSKEIAIKLNKSHSQVCQALRTLSVQEKVYYKKGKKSLDKSVRLYYDSKENAASENKPTCGSCQWLSAIQRCTLLDLAFETNPSILSSELKLRVQTQEIPRDAPSCLFFDKRVPGQMQSRQLPTFIGENKDGNYFRCPIERCKEIIPELNQSDIFNKQRIERLFTNHEAGIKDNSEILWTILNFQIWRSVFTV